MSCNAELHIADDQGDNYATMTCELDEGHEGKHQEKYRTDLQEDKKSRKIVVEWEGDDREETA